MIGINKKTLVNEKICLPSLPSPLPFINLSVYANEY
jgi:hypothetical protein